MSKKSCTFAADMTSSEFTSGPVRDLTVNELGSSGLSDFELLSDSGHNFVYRAMCGGKWVVLKCARVEEGNTTRNQQLLRREYDIMRAIDSLYVVHTWQMTDVPGLGMAIVMEYVHGRTLDAFLQERPSYSERKRVAEELLEALTSLHERQIVHGDLKGTNILITEVGNHVRLIDFGFADTDAYLAKNIGTTLSVQSQKTTSASAADTADIQRDIYAFGKILSLLFPHRFCFVRKRCFKNRYASLRDVRNALRLHSIWQLVGVIIFVAVMGTTVGALMAPQTAEFSWQTLQQQAEKEYSSLYESYADSLVNMAEPEYYAARAIINRYATRMYYLREQLITEHPEFEDALIEQQNIIYSRDYPRLTQIVKDYPVSK